MHNVYYFPFIPSANVNYFLLLKLTDIAEYDQERKAYNTVKYTSIAKLADSLGASASMLNRAFVNADYEAFIEFDRKQKIIYIKNSFSRSSKQQFVKLEKKEAIFLLQQKDLLFFRYYLFIKYHCKIAQYKHTKVDFTANQFLSAIGYSTTSANNKAKICSFN